jgi:hypothetical protein
LRALIGFAMHISHSMTIMRRQENKMENNGDIDIMDNGTENGNGKDMAFEHMLLAALAWIWVMGSGTKVELVGNKIVPKGLWTAVRGELLNRNLIQKQHGWRRDSVYIVDGINVNPTTDYGWAALLMQGMQPWQVHQALSATALAEQNDSKSISSFEFFNFCKGGGQEVWKSVRRTVTTLGLLEQRGNKRGTRYHCPAGGA